MNPPFQVLRVGDWTIMIIVMMRRMTQILMRMKLDASSTMRGYASIDSSRDT